jgi:predicted acylesterase/phospholipase RssA
MKDTLILSGGGLLGLSTLGALSVIFEEYKQSSIRRIAGTSVGALIGLLLCIKAPEEIYEIMLHQNLFDDDNIDFSEFIENFGFVKHDLVKQELYKYFPKDITFAELINDTNIDLRIVGTNISTEQCEIFCCKETPNMCVIDAVCISLSVPFVFQKYMYNNNIYGDGCLTMNYPWNVFEVKSTNKIGIQINSTCIEETSIDLFSFSQKVIRLLLLNQKIAKSQDTLNININYPFLKIYDSSDVEYLYNYGKLQAVKWLKKVK